MTAKAYIRSTGHYLPERVVENAYFEDFVETNDTWIRERTGIERRRWVAENESTATIAGGHECRHDQQQHRFVDFHFRLLRL